MSQEKIVFYDGECGFCNRSVNFILKNDKTNTIQFAAIQSNFTTELFQTNNWKAPDLSTFYFYDDGKLYQKSTGALKLTKYLKFPQRLFIIFWIVPRFIRDFFYDAIANRRQRLSKGYCVMPSIEEKKRFKS